MGTVTGVVEEVVGASREVKVFGGQAYEGQRFDDITDRTRRLNLKVAATNGMSTSFVQLIAATSLALQASRSTDAAEQEDAVRSVLRSQFRGVPLRTAETAFVPAAMVDGGGSATVVVASDDLRGRVRLVSGGWPSGQGHVAVDEAFARAHDLAVGGGFVFAGPDRAVPVTVTALNSEIFWVVVDDGALGFDVRF